MKREEAQTAWIKIVNVGFSNYDLLTKDQKIWFNIEPLTTGGIIDHYINTGAGHNKDVVAALEFLGFHDLAELVRKINALFINGEPPTDLLERNEQWDSWSDKNESLLEVIDEKFWNRNSELEKALMEHINKTGIGIE